MDGQVLRETEGICSVCYRKVNAKVVEREEKIFLDKYCPEHKYTSILISEDNYLYKDLESFYFSVMKDSMKMRAIEIEVTFRCTMDCPICGWGKKFKKEMSNLEPSLDEIEQFIKKIKIPLIKLSGGEPTCREDLAKVIKMIKRNGKEVVLNTNGLKLANLDYARSLKEAGVDRINLTFDGFDRKIEEHFRNNNYLPDKLKALGNLKRLNIPTGLNVTVEKGVNEEQIAKIFDYAAENKFIKVVAINAVSFIGEASELSLKKYLMIDQLIDIVADKTSGRISKNSIRLFQKLFIAINSFFSHRWCFYSSASFMLVREKSTYASLEKYIDLKSIERILDKYKKLYGYNKFIAKAYLFIAGMGSLMKIRSFMMFKELSFQRAINFFFDKNKYLNTDRIFYVNINSPCDAQKMDYMVARNCIFGIAFKGSDNVLRFRGCSAKVCEQLLQSKA